MDQAVSLAARSRRFESSFYPCKVNLNTRHGEALRPHTHQPSPSIPWQQKGADRLGVQCLTDPDCRRAGTALVPSITGMGDHVSGQIPVISCSGEVGSARGSTAEASVGFIDAGAGRRHGRGLARRGALGVGRWACSSAFRARRTCGRVLLPLFNSSPRSQTCESWQKSDAGLLLAPRDVSCMWVPMADMP
jgi:hypothetical protein